MFMVCLGHTESESVHKSVYLLWQEALSIIPPMTGHTPLLSFGWQQPSECGQCVGRRCTADSWTSVKNHITIQAQSWLDAVRWWYYGWVTNAVY